MCNIRNRIRLAAGGAIVGLACLFSTAGSADDKIVLKIADTLPVSHYMSVQGAKIFMARVTELTHGAVTFDYYPSEQLGKAKDLLRLVQAGVTDIAYIAPSYVSEKMPLSSVGELPGLYSSSCQGTRGFYALTHGGILDQQEFKPNGVVALMAWSVGPYQIGTRLPALHSPADMKGLKIRGAGGTWDLVLRAIGASPVNFPPPEVREAMERGTIDGSVGPAISLKPYDMIAVSKSMTEGATFGSFVATYSMNRRKFMSLPQPVQDALVQAGKEATDHLCAYIDTNEQKATQEAAAAGVNFWLLSAADKEQFQSMLAPVVKQWGDALDARHLPGTTVLQDFNAAVK
jgi:TRAP-type C4-dicarboxylate transport system substrate-binding protein